MNCITQQKRNLNINHLGQSYDDIAGKFSMLVWRINPNIACCAGKIKGKSSMFLLESLVVSGCVANYFSTLTLGITTS